MSTHKPRLKPITTVWTCRDGRKVRVCDMTDAHLVNTIRLCDRTARADRDQELRYAYAAESMMRGDGALQAIDAEQRALEADPEGRDLLPDVYYEMTEEAERRGLDTTKAPAPSEARQ